MEPKQAKVTKSTRGLYDLVSIPYQGTGLKVSKINKYLVYSSREGHVVVYDPKSCETLLDVKVSEGSLWNLDMSPDESSIISGGVQSDIFHLKFPSGEILPSFTGHTSEINHCVFSSSGSVIYSASDDGTIRVFDVVSHSSEVLLDHGRIVYAFDLSANEQFLVSGDSAGLIKIFKFSDHDLKGCRSNHSVWCLKISPHELFFVSGDSAGVLHVWTLTGELVKALNSQHSDRLRCIDFADNHETFASTGNDHLVKVWRCENWQEEVTYDLHSDWIKAVTFDKSSRTWNCISDDRSISIIPLQKKLVGIRLDVQGKTLYMKKIGHLLVYNDESISVCDFLTGDVLNQIKTSGKILEICERFDGNFLICYQNSVKVLNCKTLQYFPQEIEKIDCLVLLSPNYFYRVGSNEVAAYCSRTFSHVFTVKVNDFELAPTGVIRFYDFWTYIANHNVLNIYKKADLVKSIHMQSEINEVVQVDEDLIFVLLKSSAVIVLKNLEIKSKIEIEKDFPVNLAFNDSRFYIYTKATVYEYSIPALTLLNSITFHKSVISFHVFGKNFVVVQEDGLISIYQELAETYIVKDENSSKSKIQKN